MLLINSFKATTTSSARAAAAIEAALKEALKEAPKKALVQLTSPRGNHPRTMFVSRFRATVQTRFDNIDHTRHAHMSLPTRQEPDRVQPQEIIELSRPEYRLAQKRMQHARASGSHSNAFDGACVL